MTNVDAEPPFRWNLVRPDALGSLIEGLPTPNLPPMGELVQCGAKVIARSGGGNLVFVGRSVDSLFDFLSGVLAESDRADRLVRLPYSNRSGMASLSQDDRRRARNLLTASGVTPTRLTHSREPVAFVDLVAEGGTFTGLYNLLRDWAAETNAPWATARLKLRFIGITIREPTSPKTWRWQQHVEWTRELPADAVVNVSLDGRVWSYWGNHQDKMTRAFTPARWSLAADDGPRRDERTRAALAEAVALVALGRTGRARRDVAQILAGEPQIADRWLRDLSMALRRGGASTDRPSSRGQA